ncbi:vWA domain-containing protein [Planctomycetes bacterium TBK1r]|uniref:von Willebrand factor type A domain protein n=1 Tax=Stieleria magnilauensis TaxID=2527963 RepID=A0ABX5Y016_9BACT|nr:von Willebrand factor type A domain protein [Planctomycetes bacterium TBK1r]
MQPEQIKSNRSAKPNRQQLVVVIADNSSSMYGPKAEAAVEGIENMIIECQTKGREQSLYRVLLIVFADKATIHSECKRTPVMEIDTDKISFRGDGGGTNMRAALRLAHSQISEYLDEISNHPQKSKHPLPLVIFFSDGRNGYQDPKPAAKALKALTYDSLPILIFTAGVAVGDNDRPDEEMLKSIASTHNGHPLYVPVQDVSVLAHFLADAGSSAASTAAEAFDILRNYWKPHGFLGHSE